MNKELNFKVIQNIFVKNLRLPYWLVISSYNNNHYWYYLNSDLTITKNDTILSWYKTRAEARRTLSLYKRKLNLGLELKHNVFGYYVQRYDESGNWIDCLTPDGDLNFWPRYFESKAKVQQAIRTYVLKNSRKD